MKTTCLLSPSYFKIYFRLVPLSFYWDFSDQDPEYSLHVVKPNSKSTSLSRSIGLRWFLPPLWYTCSLSVQDTHLSVPSRPPRCSVCCFCWWFSFPDPPELEFLRISPLPLCYFCPHLEVSPGFTLSGPTFIWKFPSVHPAQTSSLNSSLHANCLFSACCTSVSETISKPRLNWSAALPSGSAISAEDRSAQLVALETQTLAVHSCETRPRNQDLANVIPKRLLVLLSSPFLPSSPSLSFPPPGNPRRLFRLYKLACISSTWDVIQHLLFSICFLVLGRFWFSDSEIHPRVYQLITFLCSGTDRAPITRRYGE